MAARTRNIVMLGGPNGAGKTTAAQVLVPKSYGVREFVNADEIARGLSPFNPEGAALAAGRLMLRRIDELLARGESFAFETTCAGRAHVHWLREAQAQGWRVSLLYLWLDSPDLARARVAQRVRDRPSLAGRREKSGGPVPTRRRPRERLQQLGRTAYLGCGTSRDASPASVPVRDVVGNHGPG